MNISKRLFELRTAKNLSQGDVEHRTGLLGCYISRVENGHTVPTLDTLEKWAKALGLEMYQLFFDGNGKPRSAIVSHGELYDRAERQLLGLFRRVNQKDKKLILHVVRDLAERADKGDRNVSSG